jgi:hypothetical protein
MGCQSASDTFCNCDGVFCKGFDDRIKMTRTQTIMQGAAYCDFTYELVDDEEKKPEPK